MSPSRSMREILEIEDCNKLVAEFFFFLEDKKNSRAVFNDLEWSTWLLLNLLPGMEMEGIEDLFHQLYSLEECELVEKYLRQLQLDELADLFGEAKSIYIGHRSQITQAEYRQIDPFALEESQLHRLEEIGKTILKKGSQIYL